MEDAGRCSPGKSLGTCRGINRSVTTILCYCCKNGHKAIDPKPVWQINMMEFVFAWEQRICLLQCPKQLVVMEVHFSFTLFDFF